MALGRAALMVLVAAVIGACSVSADPSSPPAPTPGAITEGPTMTASTSLEATDTPASPSASATPEPAPTLAPTPVPVPPKPTGVTFDEYEQMRDTEDGLVGEITQTVTWRAPQSEDVEIRVYGVTECIAEPADPPPGSSGPCLVVHTPLPASVRTLLATAPASDGVVSWTWTAHRGDCGNAFPASDPDGPAYHAVVLAAYGETEHSIFAIAEPGGWWRPGLEDIVC